MNYDFSGGLLSIKKRMSSANGGSAVTSYSAAARSFLAFESQSRSLPPAPFTTGRDRPAGCPSDGPGSRVKFLLDHDVPDDLSYLLPLAI